MEGNPRDPSHLRVRELWVRVVVRPLLPRCAPRHVKIGFKWVETMNAPASPFFFFHQKKKRKKNGTKINWASNIIWFYELKFCNMRY